MTAQSLPLHQLIQKAEHFCSYQERCHKEVVQKLYDLKATRDEIDQVLVHLIDNNFLNEERFARSFARGKHNIKKYGRIRIVNELKFRDISAHNIKKALEEIPDELYEQTFRELAEKIWNSITEKNQIKKKKKFCDYLLRKGYESDWVYSTWQEFSKSK